MRLWCEKEESSNMDYGRKLKNVDSLGATKNIVIFQQ